MKKHEKSILPVLLGGDLNAYSVALAFREAFGVSSHAFVRYKCGATENSRFIKTHAVAEADDARVAVPELLRLAAEHSDAELYLVPCADWYVELLEDAKDALSDIYNIHIPRRNIWSGLKDKCSFYGIMNKSKLPYPRFISFGVGEPITEKKLSEIKYPAVLKPSDSTEYWRHPFPDMQKVYFPENAGEACGIIYRIFDAGYGGRVIVQNRVGSTANNRVLTTFSDNGGRVVRAVFGEVILEETGRTSYGNHSAIITLPLDELCFKLIDLLNGLGYTGIANFDIMKDGAEEYVLEVNTRQGRSCDYLRAAGVNMAELLVLTASGEKIQPCFLYPEIYWHYPPHRTVLRYCHPRFSERAERLNKAGLGHSPYNNAFERGLRRAYVMLHNIRLSNSAKKSFAG